MPAGPWRAGVAVMCSEFPPGFASVVPSQGARPCAPPASLTGADDGRKHARYGRKKRPAGVIEIVGMLVVAEQHGIDRLDGGCGKRWTCRLRQRDVREPIRAGRIESRIGEAAGSRPLR